MNAHCRSISIVVVGVGLIATVAEGGIYRVVPGESDVLPGSVTTLRVEAVTEEGDNTIGIGLFSFAIDLTVAGTAGADASDISNVVANTGSFDDLSSLSLGFAQGDEYLGIAGLTTDIFPPTFGHVVGDIIPLFTFDLTISDLAMIGDTITITPSEGAVDNLIANPTFDNVAPQMFLPATVTVVPEPTTGLLCLAGACLGVLARKRRRRAA